MRAVLWWSPDLGFGAEDNGDRAGRDDNLEASGDEQPPNPLEAGDNLGSGQDAVSTKTDMFWQRNAMIRPHDLLKPFRKPKGVDINMPRVNGFEFLEQFEVLRHELDYQSVVLIMVSSSQREQDRERAESYDFVKGFLSKMPLSDGVLRQALEGAGIALD